MDVLLAGRSSKLPDEKPQITYSLTLLSYYFLFSEQLLLDLLNLSLLVDDFLNVFLFLLEFLDVDWRSLRGRKRKTTTECLMAASSAHTRLTYWDFHNRNYTH